MTTASVPSPCLGICTLNGDRDACTACFRTIDEIIDWTRYNNEEKQIIVDKCKQRSLSNK